MRTVTARLFALALLATGAAACNKHSETCNKYVDLSIKCDEDLAGDERAAAEAMLKGMCQGAFDGDYAGATADEKKIIEGMYAHIKSTATCAAKATTCEEYRRCEDSAPKALSAL